MLTSLIALKAMTSETTGAVIAAPTTSLPEEIGGARNWDYRYCWLRDSVLALEALLDAGYTDEALAFRDFLLRVSTGDPATIQIMYGIGGERRLTEFELPELPGYEDSKPVRVGNAASEQFQLDVHGEVAAVIFIGSRSSVGSSGGYGPAGGPSSNTSRRSGVSPTTGSGRRGARSGTTRTPRSWLGSYSIAPCESPSASSWRRPSTAGSGHGTRSTARSASVDMTASGAHSRSTTGPRSSTPACSTSQSSASCGTDERVSGTIDAISRELGRDGFVSRYSTGETDDGLPGDEGQFLACSFWLVNALARNGRVAEAQTLFERLVGLSNDLGLLAEEYDVARSRQVGNFPQAFSHLTLILAARAISVAEKDDEVSG